MKKLVVFTGAGISAESGLKTFRDSDGLWENYAIEDVATPQAFNKNPEMVLRFYNERRKQVRLAKPNAAHIGLVKLEKFYNVTIITQNIDDLHERAGSKNVLHLHGEIKKARSSGTSNTVISLDEKDIQIGDVCNQGYQLRPHIVWFGESVPMLDVAIQMTALADIFIIIGTSLAVYPAASLLHFISDTCKLIYIDPNPAIFSTNHEMKIIKEQATIGVPKCVTQLCT